MFYIKNQFQTTFARRGGGVNSKKENSYFCLNYVQEFSLLYFTSPFAIAKRLEMRLTVSPATPFSEVSLPNHTKMFELVHMVTSMQDFATIPQLFPVQMFNDDLRLGLLLVICP